MKTRNQWIITRRDFLKTSAVAGLCLTAFGGFKKTAFSGAGMRFGIVTDSHYAEADPQYNRYFRESIDKMNECVELMNAQKVDFLIELGDFKDQNTSPDELKTISYLQSIEKSFKNFNGPKYHVLGNHDVDSISKEQYLKNINNTGISNTSTYYSFNCKGVHFVVLDANFLEDGTEYDHGNYKWNETFVPDEKKVFTVNILPHIKVT